MSIIAAIAWADLALLAGAFAFGLAARHGPDSYADTARAIHLTFAALAVLGMLVIAIAVTGAAM